MDHYKIHEDVPLYYLTFTVIHWLPVFISAQACQIITNSLNYCHHHKGLRINAYVIMPTHLHLIVFDKAFDNQQLRSTLTAMRQYTGRMLADHCQQHLPAVFGQLINTPQRQDRARQFWQPSKHPVAIWSEPFYQSKLAYLHDNPRRKGLVRDGTHWRFSSAAFWMGDQKEGSEVELTAVSW